MASGDTLLILTPLGASFPTSNFPTLDTRNNHPVLDFDDTTEESCFWNLVMPRHYGAGGITATYIWMASGVTVNEAVWGGAFERHEDDAFDLDADGFAADQNSPAATAPSADGEVSYDTIAFTDAQIDGVLVGESFRYRAKRVAADAGDDLVGDAMLLIIELRET